MPDVNRFVGRLNRIPRALGQPSRPVNQREPFAGEGAASRLEAEGVRELVALHFYGDPGSTEVGAILTFSDRERMLDHMEMIRSWPEFGRFFATVKPLDVRVYGRLGAEAEAWIRQFGDIVSRKFEGHVAGFVR